jgi:DNA-binding NtrC family response regulator
MSDQKSALIIDDEEQLLRLLMRVLERAGYQTWGAQNAEAGLRLFREHLEEIDLVLLDVIMPGSGAAEILPRLLTERSDLKVILMSGDDLPESLESELTAIGGDFLRKPFVPRSLLRLVGADGVQVARSPASPMSGSA